MHTHDWKTQCYSVAFLSLALNPLTFSSSQFSQSSYTLILISSLVSVDGILTIKVNHRRAMEPRVSIMYFPFMHNISPPTSLEFSNVFFHWLSIFLSLTQSQTLPAVWTSTCSDIRYLLRDTHIHSQGPTHVSFTLNISPPTSSCTACDPGGPSLTPGAHLCLHTGQAWRAREFLSPEAALTLDSWKSSSLITQENSESKAVS